MSTDNKDADAGEAIKMMMEACDKNGVGIIHTSDSYILSFNRKFILDLCEKHTDEKFVICVKKPVSN